MKMMLMFIAGAFLSIGSVAWATVYEWVDVGGVVHMTDDPDKVPEKYRGVMKVKEIDPRANTIPADRPQIPAASPGAGQQETDLRGEHTRGWWTATFKDARDNLKRLADEIAVKKTNLENLRRQRTLYQKPSDRAAYYALLDDIAAQEERAKELQKNLDDLGSKADASGVPESWRSPSP
jgi:hypothetical protein